jgi:hypothetical protein
MSDTCVCMCVCVCVCVCVCLANGGGIEAAGHSIRRLREDGLAGPLWL